MRLCLFLVVCFFGQLCFIGGNASQTQGNASVFKAGKSEVWSIAFSPDGRVLASAHNDGVTLWDVKEKKLLEQLDGEGGHLKCIAFQPTSKLMAWGGDFRDAVLWELGAKQPKVILQGDKELLWSLAFSPDGKTLITGDGDQTVVVWDVETRKQKRVLISPKGRVDMVAFRADGKQFMSVSSKIIESKAYLRIWDANTFKEIESFVAGTFCMPRCAAVSPDFKQFAVCTNNPTIWDVETKQLRLTLRGHKSAPRAVAFNSDGKFLASGGQDRLVKMWDTASGKELKTFEGQAETVVSLAFSPDNSLLASGGENGTVMIWPAK